MPDNVLPELVMWGIDTAADSVFALLIAVMSLTLRNFNSFIVNNTVNKAVFLINTAGPPAGQIAAQLFGLSDAVITITFYIGN